MKFYFLALIILSTSVYSKSITIMNYNVENLFDEFHDEGKKDFTYLPKSLKDTSSEVKRFCSGIDNKNFREECFNLDWNTSVVETKLDNLAKVIKESNSGMGPDILVVEEVENISILKRLASRKILSDLGYKYVSLIEGEDERGIDIGMISKFPIKSEKLHTLNLKNPNGTKIHTRGILEVEFNVDGKTITVLGNHWPSQAAPSEVRLKAAKQLVEIAMNSKSDLVVATGDFNTLPDEYPNGIKTHILPFFTNVEAVARNYKPLNPGTHWYMTEWTSLDYLFVLNNKLNGKTSIDYNAFSIQNFDFVVGPKRWVDRDSGDVTVYDGVPKRFNPVNKTGFSDHLSIIGTINL